MVVSERAIPIVTTSFHPAAGLSPPNLVYNTNNTRLLGIVADIQGKHLFVISLIKHQTFLGYVISLYSPSIKKFITDEVGYDLFDTGAHWLTPDIYFNV